MQVLDLVSRALKSIGAYASGETVSREEALALYRLSLLILGAKAPGRKRRHWSQIKGSISHDGYVKIGPRMKHVVIAEDVIGHKLPRGAKVHHVNRNRADNTLTNLVICPDQKYHKLLHTRQEALDACGNANWLKCGYCKQYDEPQRLYRGKFHMSCNVGRQRQLRAQRMTAHASA